MKGANAAAKKSYMLGLDYARPAHHMREYLSVLIPLLEKREVSFRGEEFKVASVA